MATAPPARLVNALTGKKAPTKFFQALSEADEFCKESAELGRLTRDNDMLRRQNESLLCRVDELTAERDQLHGDNCRMSDDNRELRTRLAEARAERDNYRNAVGTVHQ